MYRVFIQHDDMEGPDGQTQETLLCSFTREKDAEVTVDHLTRLFFPKKAFYYYEERNILVDPTFEKIKSIVEEML